ncbi:MAG: zinc-dependent metalloprotease [Bacteroidota bacterium]
MSVASYAQSDRPFRQLATQKVNQQLREQNPETIKRQASIERYLQSFKQVGQVKPRVIPVVFHVLYNGKREQISEEQILTQIESLNRDFNHQVKTINHPAERLEGFADKKPERIDITFCLAEVNLADSKSIGVEYVATKVRTWQADQQIKSRKTGGADAYQPDKYLNIWVGAFDDAVSGFAQMPGGPSETDGIVIDYRFFGVGGSAIAPYDQGKTLTHLVGNYLGLHDLWNEFNPCSDDGVFDTPIHNAPNSSCPAYKHISLCSAESPVAMTMNFMDNTDDGCMNMFTFGQMIRMHAALAAKGPRHKLTTGNSKCADLNTVATIELRGRTSSSSALEGLPPSISIFPNPANDIVRISVENYDQEILIYIYNNLGQVVHQGKINQGQIELNTSTWQAGIYSLHSQLGVEKLTQKFVISH